jgi:ribonucleoside-diphosphate reductase alpha chain
MLAYDTKCKGCTVYRDGSRDTQVLYTVSKDEKKTVEKKRIELVRGEVIDAPESAPSVRIKVRTGCGKLYLIISYDINGDIIETFIETGSDGGCEVFTKSTSRLISLALRGGIPLEKVVDQLNSSGKCASYLYQKGKGKDVAPGKSCPSAIGLMLLDVQKKIKSLRKLGIDPSTFNDIIAGVDMTQADLCKVDTKDQPEEDLREGLLNSKVVCPECKKKMRAESGCVVCDHCGYSKCD